MTKEGMALNNALYDLVQAALRYNELVGDKKRRNTITADEIAHLAKAMTDIGIVLAMYGADLPRFFGERKKSKSNGS